MAGLFRSLVDGISSVGGMVTANISPYKVQLVTKPETYDRTSAVKKDGHLVLYKVPGCYECVFANVAASPKYFSLFRLTKEGEAFALFTSFSKVLSLLARSSSSLYSEEKIQLMCDTLRAHPTWNPAHVAATVGLFEAFRIKEVARLINSVDSVTGMSPLMSAVKSGQKHCVLDMLLCKARIDMADNKSCTVYHYAVRHLPGVIDLLMEHDKTKTYDWMDRHGHTPLFIACVEKPDKTVDSRQEKHKAVEMLLAGGADPGLTNGDRLPIHVAVVHEELKVISMIIKKHKSQKNARDKRHNGTPLHWAETREVTELLCQLGCDVDAVSNTKHTPLQIMLMKDRKECLMELLCYGANCNIGDNNGDTPLHWSVQRDDIELVRTFVVFGADVTQRNHQHHSPRHMASISKGKNKDLILHMLHVAGAKRCGMGVKGCMAGCMAEGTFNGKPDEKSKAFLQLDKMALFDDLLNAAVSFTATLDHCQSEAVLDLSDAPSDIGDRVLSLDGGGIRGLVLIQMLAAIEEAAGVPIKDCFDWIGGTSTGGLLALGIAVGKPLSYLKGMYFRLKDEVFKGSRPYESAPFEELLQKEFADKVMTDIKYPKVLVTAVLADRFPAELHMFRSYIPTLNKPCESQGKNDDFQPIKDPNDQLIWQAARSSGAAPTYFRTYGQFMDGGLISNNPTLDILTEIHEHNTGLQLRNDQDKIHPLGVVVSLGTGRVPVVPRDHIDVFRPSGVLEVHKAIKGTTSLVGLLVDQATVSEGRPVDRARAWCSMLNVPFFRFSPQLGEDLPLDCNNNKVLINMMWETECYIVANKGRIEQVAQLLRAGRHHSNGRRSEGNTEVKRMGSDVQGLRLHAPS